MHSLSAFSCDLWHRIVGVVNLYSYNMIGCIATETPAYLPA